MYTLQLPEHVSQSTNRTSPQALHAPTSLEAAALSHPANLLAVSSPSTNRLGRTGTAGAQQLASALMPVTPRRPFSSSRKPRCMDPSRSSRRTP